MTDVSLDTPNTKGRDASSSSPADGRTESSTFSVPPNRYSYVSSETGESSAAASKHNSLFEDASPNTKSSGRLTMDRTGRDGKGSHRSHRSRNSGAFLLSNTTFESPAERAASVPKDSPSRLTPTREPKGKGVVRSPETKHTKRRSNIGLGLGLGGSPLAAHVKSATPAPEMVPQEHYRENGSADALGGRSAGELDVDSAQIVNLALNLSESRRNAARRITSSPVPPPITTFAENIAGGSMRYHIQQQQRRSSRNVSPKPNRGDRTMAGNMRAASGRFNTPLQPGFDAQGEAAYQYHFSASTLARAEKAKVAFELMACYRELLQYVPPLDLPLLQRTTTGSSVPGSPGGNVPSNLRDQRPLLNRAYNPLQYIRNRKVRLRNSKAINGLAQGFGDVDKVATWIEEIAKQASTKDYTKSNYLQLPAFKSDGEITSPHNSPRSSVRNSVTTKFKRPRIDWITDPADMLADAYWLEQDDNKKLIEDRHGKRIYPKGMEFKPPMPRTTVMVRPESPVNKQEEAEPYLDKKLPEFKSVKQEKDKNPEIGSSRARQKLRNVRDAAKMHHRHHSTSDERNHFLRSRSRSTSSSSESESDRRMRRSRSGTADSHDRGKDILEKQMAEMIRKESNGAQESGGQRISASIEVQKDRLREELGNSRRGSRGSTNHSRSESLAARIKRHSVQHGSSGRASLDVPVTNAHNSQEDLDTTAPNSPTLSARRKSNSHIPSIAMDLSSPISRHSSPNRGFSKVRSKILSNESHAKPERNKSIEDETYTTSNHIIKDASNDNPKTPEKRTRSTSPKKKIIHRRTDDSIKSVHKSGRKERGEDSSGIRGFLRSARYPVTKVSDILWKRELPDRGTSSGELTESDSDTRGSSTKSKKQGSREASAAAKFDDLDKAYPRKEKPSYLSEMPTFSSPFDTRGRGVQSKDNEPDKSSHSLDIQQARERRRQSSRAHLLDPTPRIDIHSPISSPDDALSDRLRRGSSMSDRSSRKGSYPGDVQRADSRLNAVLGFPGRGRSDTLVITGLANLEAAGARRPSLAGERHWSISDHAVSVNRGPTTRREIARVQALLLSSGIKAKELARRAANPLSLSLDDQIRYAEVAALAKEDVVPIPRSQEHILSARLLSNDIQKSIQSWQDSADVFCNTTVPSLLDSISGLQSHLVDELTPMTRQTADEADDVSKDLVTSQTLNVKAISDKMNKMMRQRRRRFRWLRRGGWVVVEWALVGIMWYVWFMVVIARIVMGLGKVVVGSVRWLLFL